MSKESEKIAQNSDYTKLSAGEVWILVKWAIPLVYSMAPTYVLLYISAALLTSFQTIISAYILTRIMDVLIELLQKSGTALSQLYPYMIMLLGLSILKSIVNFTREYSRRHIDLHSTHLLEQALYKKLHSLGIETLEDPEVSNMINRAERELYQVGNFFYRSIDTSLSAVNLIIRAVIVFAAVPFAIPAILLFSIPKFLYDKKHRSILWRFGYENTENTRKGFMPSTYLSQNQFLKEVILSNAFNYLDKKYMDFVDWYVKARLKIHKDWYKQSYFFDFMIDLGIYISYLMSFAKFLAAKVTVGDVFFQIRMIESMSAEFNFFTSVFNNLFESSMRVRDAYKLFELKPFQADGAVEMERLEVGPVVAIKNLTFSYPRSEKVVVENLSVTIKAGEKVAIVGHNGAGKTTLLKLLARIHSPNSGGIYINGTNLKDFKLETYHQNLGVLFQEYSEYASLTLKENIIMGNPDEEVDEEKIIDAVESADALDFINELPNRFDQLLSERYTGGTRLSTGQWQKLAIARFFYRNAPLIIFDEPTAAIDAVSEYNIFNKIYSFFAGKTVIIISHRFSTVRNADRIIVLEKGRIIEEGSHQQLIEKNGYYAESFRLQAEGYSIV